MSIFKHKTPIEIRFADVDAFGHVNNARFLTYIEMARVKYFDEVVEWGYDWSKEGIILARAEVDTSSRSCSRKSSSCTHAVQGWARKVSISSIN